MSVGRWRGGVLLWGVLAAVLTGCSARRSDWHPDSEVAREALMSGARNMEKTQMTIHDQDVLAVGGIILNQFLGAFRRSDTRYGIRLRSYEVLRLGMEGRRDNELAYTAEIRVVPQDTIRSLKIVKGVFPCDDSQDGVRFSLRLAVHQEGDLYRLVDVSPM